MRSTGTPAATSRIIGIGGDWEIRQMTDGTVIADLCGDGSTMISTTTPLTESGQWYHVAATFDSSNNTYAIYVNGVLELSGTNGSNMVQQPAAVLSFGTRTGSTEYWQGALRDFRVYNRRLCPTEIADLGQRGRNLEARPNIGHGRYRFVSVGKQRNVCEWRDAEPDRSKAGVVAAQFDGTQ